MLEMAATHVNALQLVNVKIRYAPNLTARRLGAEVMQIARNAVFVTFLMISVGFKASVVCVPADPLIAKQAVSGLCGCNGEYADNLCELWSQGVDSMPHGGCFFPNLGEAVACETKLLYFDRPVLPCPG